MENGNRLIQEQDPSQEYVSSEEFVRALTSIESQQAGESADRLKVGEAIRQLGLDITPEQLLAQVKAERAREAATRQRATSRTRTIKLVAAVVLASVLVSLLIAWLDHNTATRPRQIAAIPSGLGTDFDSLMQTLRTNSFDDGKVAFVKVMAKNRTFTVDQARAVLTEMSFDQGRLQAAEILYPRISDPRNAYRLLDTMTFDQGRQDMISRLGLDRE